MCGHILLVSVPEKVSSTPLLLDGEGGGRGGGAGKQLTPVSACKAMNIAF